MKNKGTFYKRLVLALISVVLLGSFLAFSSTPDVLAQNDTEGGQSINALVMGQAWVTSYDDAGGLNDIAYVPFGNYFGFSTELSAYSGAVVDNISNSYVLNWRPNLVGSSMYVCGLRVAYRLPDGVGGYSSSFSYLHIPGSVLVVSSIFRTFRNHLVVVPPDVACSSTFSVPRVILACTSAWHTLTSRQTVHLGTRRPSWFCA